MPKVTVYVSADLKARMDQHRARFDWPGAARAAWEALIESEEEREQAEADREEAARRARRFGGATGTAEERADERAAWEARKAELRRLWQEEDEAAGRAGTPSTCT